MSFHAINTPSLTACMCQPVVGVFGLVGNLLTILVLATQEMNTSFNKLITALSIFDSIFIVFVNFEYTFVRGTRCFKVIYRCRKIDLDI